MKKSFLLVITILLVGFISAVGLCFKALQAQTVAAFSDGSMRVVVDAGHGGVDGGVVGRKTGVTESDLNLSVSMALKSRLEEMGFEVVLTRKTDAGLYGTTAKGFKKRDMLKRKEIIQNVDPALLISVHQNFYPSRSARGGQVFYLEENEGGKSLSNALQERLNELYQAEGVRSRKPAKGEYFMLECHSCPSVIVECGFLSNAEDEKLLCNPLWQKKIAASIVSGVVDFLSNAAA